MTYEYMTSKKNQAKSTKMQTDAADASKLIKVKTTTLDKEVTNQ